jgi:KaiC/GvpD/RAD55 family RecA-like ATPase
MEKKIERIKTGIPGLDEIIEGGFIPGSAILISGGAGSGKTIFCGQFLWRGLKNDEPGIYVTCEETPEDIKNDLKKFGWDFEKYEKEKKFSFLFADPFGAQGFSMFDEADFTSRFVEEIKKIKAKRFVFDSVSVMGLYFKDVHETRRRVYMLIQALKKAGVTSLLTSEIPEGSEKLSRFEVEEFVVDGIIKLEFIPIGARAGRYLLVRKMRRTKHDENPHPIEIGENGIRVLSL